MIEERFDLQNNISDSDCQSNYNLPMPACLSVAAPMTVSDSDDDGRWGQSSQDPSNKAQYNNLIYLINRIKNWSYEKALV